MTSVNNFFNLSQIYSTNSEAKTTEENHSIAQKSSIETKTNYDTVSLGQDSNSEKFEKVFAEFDKNVPDMTTTIPQKELAISYIDRMLACNDITDDLKIYWQNKKDVIKQEIQMIKNEEKIGSGEKVNDVWKEFQKFYSKYQNKLNSNLSNEDKKEFAITYSRTCQSYIKRLLACSDITDDLKNEYEQMYKNYQEDIKNIKLNLK